MQYVNDDMDELFKRAAEDYPLDTKSADWNKVLAALNDNTGAKTISEDKRNKNGRLLWLLLLLPLGLICNQLYSPGTVNKEGLAKAGLNEENVRSVVATDKKSNDNNNVVANSTTIPVNENPENIQDQNRTGDFSKGSSTEYKTTVFNRPATNLFQNHKQSSFSSNNASSSDGLENNFQPGGFTNEETFNERRYVSEIAFSKTLGDLMPNTAMRKLDPLITSPKDNSKKPIRVAKQKKFYVGLMGGVDATAVKFQKIDSVGATYGLMLGYQLNKKLSIETGVYLEKKYYYTEGQYFNAYKIYPNMPSNYWLDNISGSCKMIEIPVALKYNLASNKNSGLFATVGATSYIMKKERYFYTYYYGSVSSYGKHEKDTNNSTKNLFSNLSISAGYSHRLGNFADIRIEPYVKLPLSKMGIGSLPLFSTGLQVGLTRKF